MHLVMFDMDGTLTDTNPVDAEAYAQAVHEVLDIPDVETDWSVYTNVTDGGCLEEIVVRHLGRPALDDEVRRVRERFIEILEHHARRDPSRFRPLAGAAAMVESLVARPGVTLAIATGAWRESAELKLRTAGLAALARRLPLATGSEALARMDIMRLAERRALAHAAAHAFTTKIYVGDALWDVKAADALGYRFIGIASQRRAEALRRAGAERILPHFDDLPRFLVMLEEIWSDPR